MKMNYFSIHFWPKFHKNEVGVEGVECVEGVKIIFYYAKAMSLDIESDPNSLKMKMNYFSIHFWPKFHKNKVGVEGAEIKFYYTSLDIESD